MTDPRTRTYLPPARIAWHSPDLDPPEVAKLLKPGDGQISLARSPLLVLRHRGGNAPGVMLDFGIEMFGGIRITVGTTTNNRPVNFRIRFGESFTEAMTLPNQDHAIHDQIAPLAFLGTTEVGATGFRFVRLDVIDENAEIEIQAIHAVSILRPLEQIGSFECSDSRLNRIWQTGARTVHLCMQDYLWDGIKRDKLVWIGDMHPEARVISTVFGENQIIPQSLDFARNEYPLPGWMNGIASYSLWWIIIHRDWYWHYGRLDYLAEQRSYLLGLLDTLHNVIGPDGREKLPGRRFLDWPSSSDTVALHAGLQGLLAMAFKAGADLCEALNEPRVAQRCRDDAVRLRRPVMSAPGSKQANALLVLSGLADAVHTNKMELSRDPLEGVSTFYGYYLLQARAMAGDFAGCMDLIRTFWGAMLDRGATTFWEDFNLSWLENSGRIDEATPPGKKDLHADFGAFCYLGLRHSLCHGWAAGPTAWLSEHVLGITPLSPGFKSVQVQPRRLGLDWAWGTYPTPLGPLRVELVRAADGTPETIVKAPDGMKVERI
jgi:hypothetical protein